MSDEQTVACYEVSSAGIQKVRVKRKKAKKAFQTIEGARYAFSQTYRPQKPRVKFVKQM